MLIPYIGEKSRYSNFITPYIPTDILIYSEPFGGMMGIFFSLNFMRFKNVKFIYNDKNHLNYLLFKKLSDDNFIDLVRSTKVTEDLYKKYLKGIITEKNENLLALYWLVVLTCSAPQEIGKSSWRSDKEFELFKLKFNAYRPHVHKINEIHNLDYKDIIKMYDSESTFFYVDPPYKGKEKYYINHDFVENTHIELADILNNIKGRFLLSYYHFDGMEELYSNCRIESEEIRMGTEYIIMNYQSIEKSQNKDSIIIQHSA